MEQPYYRKSGKQFAQDIVDGLRIGLATRGAHDLAHKKLENTFVAGFEFGDVAGILFDHFSRGLLDRGVADLRAEASRRDDFGCTTAGFEHGGEDFLSGRAGNLAGFDEFY